MKRCAILFISVCLLLVSSAIPVSAQPVTVAASQSTRAGDRLPVGSFVRQIYEVLVDEFNAIANGERASTSFEIPSSKLSSLTWTAKQLQVDSLIQGSSLSQQAQQAVGEKVAQALQFSKMTDCLLADCPYSLYWYDKSSAGGARYRYGISSNGTSIRITSLTLEFTPLAAYKGSGDFTVDTSKTRAAKNFADYAKTIVQNNAHRSDLEKLEAYRAAVCDLVSYNNKAIGGAFGDAWQLIYVFDRNTSTNVVCEGYAKAFQYLCNLSSFSGNVTSYLLSGTMTGATGAGGHMWNVVCIDGTNYLVDVTNCDTGTVGATHKLFLVGATSSDGGRTHTVKCGSTNIVYTYYQDQADLFCDGYLKLSDQSLSSSTTTTKATTTTTKKTTTTTKQTSTTTTTKLTATTTQKTTTATTQPSVATTTAASTQPSIGTTTTTAQPSIGTTTVPTTVPPATLPSTTSTLPSTAEDTPTSAQPTAPSATASPQPDASSFPIALAIGAGVVLLIVFVLLIKRR